MEKINLLFSLPWSEAHPDNYVTTLFIVYQRTALYGVACTNFHLAGHPSKPYRMCYEQPNSNNFMRRKFGNVLKPEYMGNYCFTLP